MKKYLLIASIAFGFAYQVSAMNREETEISTDDLVGLELKAEEAYALRLNQLEKARNNELTVFDEIYAKRAEELRDKDSRLVVKGKKLQEKSKWISWSHFQRDSMLLRNARRTWEKDTREWSDELEKYYNEINNELVLTRTPKYHRAFIALFKDKSLVHVIHNTLMHEKNLSHQNLMNRE